MKTNPKRTLVLFLHIGVHIGAILPLLWLFTAIPAGKLGGDPVQELIHFLGLGAIRLLLLTLTVTPLARKIRLPQLNRLRRPLGLWAFAWATAHFVAWMVFDLALEWSLIGEELIKRTYILLGFAVWLTLLVLAITSLPRLVRAMGKHWKTLHRSIYLLIILACVHFWWSLKSGWIEPVIYLVIAFALLGFRKKYFLHLLKKKS